VSASNSARWIYSNNDPQADERIGMAEAGIDLSYKLSRFSEVRAGYDIGYLNARLKFGSPQICISQTDLEGSQELPLKF
jgi:hypothetical protein